MSAQADYDDGTSQDVTEQARWEVSDAAVAEVDNGLVSALAPGTVTVTASFGEFSAEAEITVTEAELVSVTLDKTELQLSAYHSETLSAAANYADGTSININAEAEWTSSSADIAAVSTESTGSGTAVTVQGFAPGTAVITAAYKGLTAQCRTTVSDNPITALEICPESGTTVPAGETIKLRAMATFSDQTEADVSSTADWSSNKPEKAEVDKGTVTGLEEDDAVTVTAKAGGFEASVNIKVGYNYIIFNSVSESVPDLEKYLGYTVDQDVQGNYHIYQNGAEVTALVIPATFVYENEPYCITGLNQEALHHCVNLKSVIIPDTVSFIGVSCFKGCTQLQSAEMPDIVNYIGEFAFADCPALTGLTLPGDITYILESTFENCAGLTSITVPSQVTSIDNKAFAGCGKLESVGLPDSLTSVGEEAFLDCEKLQTLNLPQNLESLGKNAFKGCTSLTAAAVPAKITAVAEGLFAGCENLQTVGLYAGTQENPPVLTSIGAGAFENCRKLELSAIPGLKVNSQYHGVTSIGDRAFKGCESIAFLTVPDEVSSIGDEAFADVQHIYYQGTAEGQPWGANEMN
ncbi:MAG: leucine-rich repeat protein [bacterium]|nr:leucine-rich repeat protein [bacterium]